MFNSQYFTSLHTKGFQTLLKVGEGMSIIDQLGCDLVNGNPTIIVVDMQGLRHYFDLAYLGWFKDDGRTLVLESSPIPSYRGIRCERWVLSRKV